MYTDIVTRKGMFCDKCGREIKKKEWFLKSTAYRSKDNCCVDCLKIMTYEIIKENHIFMSQTDKVKLIKERG